MGCTSSTPATVTTYAHPSKSNPHTTASSDHHRRWPRSNSSAEMIPRDFKFLVLGNGCPVWIKSLKEGLKAEYPDIPMEYKHAGAHDSCTLQQQHFQIQNANFQVLYTNIPKNFSVYDHDFTTTSAYDVLIYTVSLCGYDQIVTTESGIETNRMEAALEQFKYLVNTKCFRKKDIVLYFTDVSEFEQKIRHSPVCDQVNFRNFRGGADSGEALMYFGNRFKDCMSAYYTRELYMHLLKGPSATILSFVDTAKTIELTSGLVRSGFLKVEGDDEDSNVSFSGLDVSARTGTTFTENSSIPSFISF